MGRPLYGYRLEITAQVVRDPECSADVAVVLAALERGADPVAVLFDRHGGLVERKVLRSRVARIKSHVNQYRCGVAIPGAKPCRALAISGDE